MKWKQTILFTTVFTVIVLSAMFLIPQSAYAYERYDSGFQIIPDCALEKGNCTADDFIQMFVNAASVGLKVLPYITMIMMIWAGFNLIMAGGNPTKIQEGKKMVGSIVIGIIIILFLAWAWSSFIVVVLTDSPNVFPEYGIWEREWWGGGEGELVSPIYGCCTITDLGCEQTDETTCSEYRERSGKTTQFQQAKPCNVYTDCANYRNPNTCCVPDDGSNDCHPSSTANGCLNYAGTHTWNSNPCENIGQCNPNAP